MEKRRLSYGLMVIFAAAFAVGCGDPQPEVPTPGTATPADTAQATAPADTAQAAPPPAETAKPAEPPPPPPKPAKDKWSGKFVQDFSGDVMNAADADAKKKAGKADK